MADAAIHGHEHPKPGFFTRWFMSTNHKDIGILYLLTGGLTGLVSVMFTVYMRLELMEPGVQYMCAEGLRLVRSRPGRGPDDPVPGRPNTAQSSDGQR